MMKAISFAVGLSLVGVVGAAVVLSADERDAICKPGFAAGGRPSPNAWLKLRQEAFEAAGVNFAAHHHDYEVDHIIPRCLDGPNTLDNLQLQHCTRWEKLTDGRDGPRCMEGPAYDKDVKLEIPICRAYCAKGSRMTLEQARSYFKRDAP